MEPRVVYHPWGKETWIASNEFYTCCILHIKRGASVSLHYHTKKVETLYVEEGTAEYYLQKPGEPMQMRVIKPGDILEHRPYEIHRERALEDMKIIEISTPEVEDKIRVEDEYGRT